MKKIHKDSLWRRFLIWLGIKIICFAERIYICGDDITWIDELRWFIEDIGSRIFSAGHVGSQSEEQMILNGEIPWEYVELSTRKRMVETYPEYFEEAHER